MATIRETILEYPSIEDMEGFLDKVVFIKRGINPEAECTTESMKQVGLCVADMYAMMVNSGKTGSYCPLKSKLKNPPSAN